ncbi:ABC transporter permease [Gluconobacter cerinus]|uniref:ABC transporter permease n=1 Tax=Gluconobacter cerinus TaxID=38307 RepID=UPI001B8D58A6|nr:ABC transporter permease [Gluconobacter cerinus]MBS0994614.1 ABC transporter permease [Gluconobacter cerinus]
MLITILRNIVRQARRQPLYLALNVIGLGLGMAVCLVLTLQVRYEYSFNASIPDAANVLRLDAHHMNPGNAPQENADVPFIAFPFLHTDFPQILATTRYETADYQLHAGDRRVTADTAMVDPSFFDVITLKLERGNARTALTRPDAIVLSANTAQALFGTTNVLGRIITTDHEGHRVRQTVTAILARPGGPVTIRPDAVTPIPFYEMEKPQFTRWGSSAGNIFVRVHHAADRGVISQNLTRFVIDHASGDANDDKSEGVHPERHFRLSLVSLRETHFHDLQVIGGDEATDRSVVNILELIGALALLLAVFNAVNLATARAGLRAREVAIRKTLGATRMVLFVQFVGEAIVNTAVGGALALALCEVALPFTAALTGTTLHMDYGFTLPFLFGIVLLTGLACGLYPAIILSSYQPAHVLAATRMPSGGRNAARLRNGLVIIQFAFAVAFAICTLVVNRQANFMQMLDLGFAREGVLISSGDMANDAGKQRALIEALRHTPGVVSTCLSELTPNIDNRHRFDVTPVGLHSGDIHVLGDTIVGDYVTTYRPRLLAGRWFDSSHGEDDSPGDDAFYKAPGKTWNVVLNRTALSRLGFVTPESAVGALLKSGSVTLRVIGVTKDMRFISVREDVSPQITFYSTAPQTYPHASVRFSGASENIMRTRLKSAWDQVFPDAPSSFETVQERMSTFYITEQRRGWLFSIASGIAVTIACLGLYGLASFIALRRTHEVGIRKALGATSQKVLTLMLRDFLRPVLVACALAAVPAWLAVQSWLSGFHQRISVSWLDFAIVVSGTTAIAALTVLGQTLRLARAEPARALRAE